MNSIFMFRKKIRAFPGERYNFFRIWANRCQFLSYEIPTG